MPEDGDRPAIGPDGWADAPSDPAPALPVTPESFLEQIPGVVGLVDANAVVVWVNEAVTEVSGYRPDELIGTNLLDYLDLDWNPLALESIGYAMDHPGRRLPAMLRFRSKDGTPIVMEATANNQLENPDLRALVTYLRPCDEQQLLDQVLESIASGEELETTLALLHPLAGSETLRADCSVVLVPADGEARPAVLAADPELADLVGSLQRGSPWARSAWSGTAVAVDVAELPDDLAGPLGARGYQACWAHPVGRSGGDGVAAVLVFWRRVAGPPEPSASMLINRLVRLTGLVIERAEYARHLHHAATHDQLTGLANRVMFFDQIERHLAADGPGLGVVYLDLDGFKHVNDRYGHGHGDQVLVRVADRLRALVRPGDLAARFGGDEFALCCPGATTEELRLVADRLLDVIPAPIRVGDVSHRVGVSLGLAAAEPGACSADVVVAAADAALLLAKATAKGTWQAAPTITPG